MCVCLEVGDLVYKKDGSYLALVHEARKGLGIVKLVGVKSSMPFGFWEPDHLYFWEGFEILSAKG